MDDAQEVNRPEKNQELRRTGLGSSDAPKCYVSPLDVYLEKKGLADPPDLSEVEAVYWGSRLEPIILEEVAIREELIVVGKSWTGELWKWGPDIPGGRPLTVNQAAVLADAMGTIRDPERDYLFAHLDGIAFEPESLLIPDNIIAKVEAKTTHSVNPFGWGEEEDEVPTHVLIQIAHADNCFEAAFGRRTETIQPLLRGGQVFKTFRVEANERLGKLIREKELEVWSQIVHNSPPQATPDKAGANALAKLFPKDDGVILQAVEGDEVYGLILEVLSDKAARKEAAAAEDRSANLLREVIGSSAEIHGPGVKATWKKGKDGTKVDWEKAFFGLESRILSTNLTENCEHLAGEAAVILKVNTHDKPGVRRLLVTEVKAKK